MVDLILGDRWAGGMCPVVGCDEARRAFHGVPRNSRIRSRRLLPASLTIGEPIVAAPGGISSRSVHGPVNGSQNVGGSDKIARSPRRRVAEPHSTAHTRGVSLRLAGLIVGREFDRGNGRRRRDSRNPSPSTIPSFVSGTLSLLFCGTGCTRSLPAAD